MPFADPREVLSEKETPLLVKTEPLLTNVLLCQTLSAATACSLMDDSEFKRLSCMAKSLNPQGVYTLTPLAKMRMAKRLLEGAMQKRKKVKPQPSKMKAPSVRPIRRIRLHPRPVIDLVGSDSD